MTRGEKTEKDQVIPESDRQLERWFPGSNDI